MFVDVQENWWRILYVVLGFLLSVNVDVVHRW